MADKTTGGLRNKLQQMPVTVQVPDPVTNKDFTYTKADVIAALVVDLTNVVGDAAIVAGQYADAARMERACASAADRAATQYAQWKAEIASAYRIAMARAEKKSTDKGAEQAYRTHKDYESVAGLAAFYANLRDLFGDVKKAFDIKSRMLGAIVTERRGLFGVEGASGTARVPVVLDSGASIEDLEAEAARSIEESRRKAGLAPVPPAPPKAAGKPAPIVDGDEDEEDDEDAAKEELRKAKEQKKFGKLGPPPKKPKAAVVEDEDEDEEEEDEPPKKGTKPSKPPAPPKRPKAPVVEDDEEDDEEDEDDEPQPPKRGGAAKAPAVEDDDEDEDEEEDDEDEEPPPPRRTPRKGK